MKVGASSLFVGQHEHSLDPKGRVVLPSAFRASVAEKGIVTRLDQCIGLWTEEGFEEFIETYRQEQKAGRLSLRALRTLMASGDHVKLDAAGRITLPRKLLNDFGFKSQVVVVGMFDRVEIWPLEKYEDDLNEEAGAELAEAILRIGI